MKRFYKIFFCNKKNKKIKMLVQFPMINRFIRLLFILGITFYSFGITFLYTSKNYFYLNTILNTMKYIFFGSSINEKYIHLLWDTFINGILIGYYISLFNFVTILGFLVYCDAKNFIDENCIIYIPLMNMKFITLQFMNHQYNMTFSMEYTLNDIKKYIENHVKYGKELFECVGNVIYFLRSGLYVYNVEYIKKNIEFLKSIKDKIDCMNDLKSKVDKKE